jgi:hypothetical protein
MRTTAIAVLLSVGTSACTYTYDYVRVPQPEVERAGHAVLEGSTTTVRTEKGQRIGVKGDTNVLHEDPTQKVSEFSLRSLADACWGTQSVPCSLTSGGEYKVRVKRTIPDKDAWLAAGLVTLASGVVATYVTAQVTCFSSWCDDVGKGVFVASDVALGALGAFAVAGFWYAVMRGLAN